MTLIALLLFCFAAHRLVESFQIRERWLAIFALVIAFLCVGYTTLGLVSVREPKPDPLVFVAQNGDPVTVREDSVVKPRAHPAGLALFAGALALLSTRLPQRRQSRSRLRDRLRNIGRSPVLWVLALPYLATLIAGFCLPARGYDALWYHLPLAVGFARNQHFEPPGRDLVFYFPANVELIVRTLYDLFGARALSLVQWPFAFAAALGARSLARAIGLARHSHWAAALVLASPLVIFQSQLAYADVVLLFCVAFAAAQLVGAVRALRSRDAFGRATLAGLMLGVAMGAKYAALPLCAALLPVLALYALFPSGKLYHPNVKRALLVLATVGVAASLPAWFWYFRNFRLTGNPLFPIAVPWLKLPGLFLSKAFNAGKEQEFVSSPSQWIVYPWIEKLSHESGLGAAYAALVPVGLTTLGLAFIHRLRRRQLPAFGLPLLWGALYLLFWWVGTPHEPRHLAPLLVLFAVPSLFLLEPLRTRASIQVALTCGVLVSSALTVRALIFSPVADLSIRPRSYADLYDLPPELTAAIPDGAKVANRAGRPYNFPLLGPRRNWRLFDYTSAWPSRKDIEFHGIDYLVYRGSRAELKVDSAWTLVYQGPAKNHLWWEAGESDVIACYRVR